MEAPQPQSHARIRRLVNLSLGAFAIGVTYYWFNSPWPSMHLNALAILMCFMGIWPMLKWLLRNDTSYPLMEVMQMTLVPFYAVPLMTAHEAVVLYPESVLIKAAWLVVVFQICCSLGGLVVERNFRPARFRPWWSDELFAEDNLKFTNYTLGVTTAWLLISNFTEFIPSEMTGTLRAIFFGIGIISGFIQARMWGSGHLDQSSKIYFAVNIVLQMILSSLSLLLISSLITFLLVMVGYFSAARRVPLLACAIALPIFVILHSGKTKMREIYWSNISRLDTIDQVPAYYYEWFQYGLESGGNIVETEENTHNRSNLFERASLFQIVCYAVDTVPDRTAYLNGDTYVLIPPQIVPRFLWPDKPSPNDSVKILSVRLGLLNADQAKSTSIGYGLIAESYINFGLYGTAVLGFIVGWGLHQVSRATAICTTLSMGGIFRILALAWCLNTETTLVVWTSSFYQACIAIFAPLYAYRSLFSR